MIKTVTSFLASNEAIQWLGLPGFVALLAFLFYRYLVEKGIISKLTKNGSLAVILSIIAFFAFALYIAIDAFSDNKRAYTRDEVISFLERINFSTRKGDVEKFFGPPSSEEVFYTNGKDKNYQDGKNEVIIKVETYQKFNSIYLAIYFFRDEIVAYGLWGKGVDLPIPMYFKSDDKLSEIPTLGNFSAYNLHGCSSGGEDAINTRTQWFLVGPCYFGAAGKYSDFAFAFADWSDRFKDCGIKGDVQEWWGAYNREVSADENPNLPCKSMKNITAAAVAVSVGIEDEEKENFPNTRVFLNDFVDRIAFGKGFI